MRWRVSAWTHPASGNFRCVHHSIPILGGTFSDPEEPRGRMSFSVPVAPTETTAGVFSWQDLINSDPATPANNRNTLIRIYRDGVDNTGEPDMEFYVERWQRRITDDGVEVMQISGPDWRVAGLDPAVARWWDYEAGATETRQPNWEYGGRNILRDDGFETTGEIPTVYELVVDATAGTYDITDGTDIATLSFDANASTIENTIESNIASITDINVEGAGTEDDPFVLEFKVPTFGVTLTADDSALTGTANLGITQEGGFDTGNWTRAQTVSDGTPKVYGAVASNDGFAVTTEQAHTGTKSLRINPLDVETHGRYTGGQVVISGLDPGIYQASIWVRPTTATDLYRFVLRTVWGDTIERADGQLATDTGALGGTAFPADTWTEVTIPDVVIPLGVSEIIFRFSNVNPTGNPGVFYLDDPSFARGLAASTIGKVSNQLIADAQVDHAPPAVIPWVTEGAYTDTLASDGSNWIRAESLTIQRGKHYGTDIYAGQFYDLGYVHDLIPGDGQGGRTTPDQANWYLEIYNPGTQGETLTDTAFLLAYGIGGGVTAGRVPKQTRILAEGKGGIITEVSDATQEGQFGVWQEFLGEPDITDATTLAGRATEFLNRDLKNIIAVTAELDPDGPVPYQDFQRGDTANFVAGSYFSRHERRITEISLTAELNAGGELDWTPAVTASKLLTGERARNEAIYRLLSAYKRIPEEGTRPQTTRIGGGSGAPVLAASNAPDWMRQGARWVCDGFSDQAIIADVLAEMAGRGNIYLTPGDFNIDMTAFAQGGPGLDVPTGTNLIGAGMGITRINLVDADPSAITAPLVDVGGFSNLQDLTVEAYGGVTAIGTDGSGFRKLERIETVTGSVHIGAGNITHIRDCVIEADFGGDPAITIDENANITWISGCQIQNGVNNIKVGGDFTSRLWITDNRLGSADATAIDLDITRAPFGLRITNNLIDNWGNDAATLINAAIHVHGVAAGGISGGPDEDYGGLIADNHFEAGFGHGIRLTDATGIDVSRNYLEDVSGHGIWAEGDTDHCAITDNRIFLSADENPGNTWDMIHVDGTENIIARNTTRDDEAGASLHSRYALVLDGNENWVFDNDFRGTGDTGEILDNGTGNKLLGQHATWIDYTPTWTAPTTNPVLNSGTLVGRYKVIDGNTITGHLRLVIAADTTLGSGEWQFDLPVDPAPAYDHALGSAHVEDVGTGWHTGVGIWNDTDGVVNVIDSGGAGLLDATIPIAWATDDVLTVGFSYEIP